MVSTVPALETENIEALSRAIYNQDYENAVVGLINVLHAMELGGARLKTMGSVEDSVRMQSLLASAVTALLADPSFSLSVQGVSALMALKSQLRTLFASSAFRDMSHVATIIGDRAGDSLSYNEEAQITKYLLVMTLDYAEDDMLEYTRNLEPSQRLLFWLGCLDSRLYAGKREDRLRHKFLELTPEIEDCSANSIAELQMLTRVWMNCSYWSYPNKHQAKRTLNRVLSNTLEKLGVHAPPLSSRAERDSDKPRIVVIAEFWDSNHSMYRCYANAIGSLVTDFEVIGMVVGSASNDKACEIFHEHHQFEVTDSLQEVVNKIAGFAPDIIYYPSLGMQQSVIQLAQLRLAPIQLMTAGHPASSFSDQVDYMVLEEDMLSNPETINETVLLTRKEAFSYRRLPVELPTRTDTDRQEVHVAISSIFYKLSPDFIEVLGKIAKAADSTVHFHFLAGLNAMNRVPFERDLASLENVTCHELMPYEDYLEVICNCDLQLAPFPFGNANGFADAMLVGLPIVCMDGDEIHSHTDAALGRRIGIPEDCITSSIDEYKAQALLMIDDVQARESIADHLKQIDLSATLFGDVDQDDSADFAKLLLWLFDNHGSISHKSRKVWTVEDRRVSPLLSESGIE